jgi:hypothetical protein
MFENLRSKIRAATGGGSKLPPVAPPKVKPKQQSYPDYLTTTTPSSAVINKVDPRLANVDISPTYRLGNTTNEVMRNLARANPDLSAAVSAYLRVGIPERYFAIARDPDGTVNDEATILANEILSRFDKLPTYESGFSQVDSIRSTSEALAKEGILYGGMAFELVLDKGRLPYKFQPVSVTRVKFYEDNSGGTKGLKPIQDVGGTEIDLDIPTFFMVHLDPSLLDPYPQSPMDAAIQPVLMSSTFLSDLRRIMARHVYPRYDVAIDEEKLKATIPVEILADPEQLPGYLNGVIEGIESTINDLGVEEALIHYDFVVVSYIKNDDGQGTAEKLEVLKNIIDANLAKGAKVLPAVLGNGSGSQNVASTETMLFMLSANSSVRLKLQELYSKGLTLACRLYGMEVTVEFEFDPIELRPATELAAFKTMEHERIKSLWSLGLMSDMEASLRLTYKPTPKGFKPISGTYFMTGGDVNGMSAETGDGGNAYSGTGAGGGQSGGGAANQSRKTGTPSKSKSKQNG